MDLGYFYTLSAITQAFAALIGLVLIVAIYRMKEVGSRRDIVSLIAQVMERTEITQLVLWTIIALVVIVGLSMWFLPWGKCFSYTEQRNVVILILISATFGLGAIVFVVFRLWRFEIDVKEELEKLRSKQ